MTWISVTMGQISDTTSAKLYARTKKEIQGGAIVTLTAPYKGGWIAALVKKQDAPDKQEVRRSAQLDKTITPLLRVVDLKIGESQLIELCNGEKVKVKLLDLKETRDNIRDAIREAQVVVEIDGEAVTLKSGNYHLPVTTGDVQIDCPITHGYYSNTSNDDWGLDKDVRLRLWPAGSPFVQAVTFGYPVKQRWFASHTWMGNQPVDGGDQLSQRIYYHSGLDIGGAEGMVEVIAATDGLVVSSGEDVLEAVKHDDTPIRPRYDVVYVMDSRGW
ncbi:MAG: hypothetical protein ACI9R3_005553 [Verrucomicrobiales bacterium]